MSGVSIDLGPGKIDASALTTDQTAVANGANPADREQRI
jgi:hypothetical protein